jgi:N-acetylglucosamine kinase-like BadF-type ATPase
MNADVDLYLGVDAGGTRTRAAVIDRAGRVVGAADGGPGNPVSHPWPVVVAAVAATATAALDAVAAPASAVAAAVIGMAGTGVAPSRGMAVEIADRIGLARPPLLVGDAVVAYAAGTGEPDGCALIAGTGATAARIAGWQEVATVDGHGWLLGDAGSAFWLGRAAVRAALAAIEGHREPTALLAAVTAALLPAEPADGRGIRGALIAAVHAEPPVALARFAPLVSTAAADGDEVARRIVAAAVEALAGSMSGLRTTDDRTPIVVVGAVANGDGLLGAAVRAELDRRWPGCVCRGGDTAAAAARLAAGVHGRKATFPPIGGVKVAFLQPPGRPTTTKQARRVSVQEWRMNP